MRPGNSQILTCPFCGMTKEILSLISGNTFGAELWSDNKKIAPMLPEISYIQKCPKCGKYYIIERQETIYAKNGYSLEQGLLTYPEVKEAFIQLSEEGFISKQEESKVRIMLHHAYNDYYFRNKEDKEIKDNDRSSFHDNALWLINNIITDNVLKAEFYREIGELETAYTIIKSTEVKDDFLKKLITSIKEKIENKDCTVFRIQ